ncbi:alkyl sulfatase dimerization domain-containing protein [Halomonas sp. BC1]|uniref:alkyl sulfatase dimerization domain-containing protein n=1 Tax=Halomonas sp. BC1 TaxID=1670448 RepID=UPI0009BCF074|nr:alkyl sulfatase dimerization domain-containing protein [Halomonas sp. BC1]
MRTNLPRRTLPGSLVRRPIAQRGLALVLLFGASLLAGCDREPAASYPPAATPDALHAHGEEFAEDVIQVTDNIYVAIGFGIANSIMIEGDDGVIIVDTMESMEAGRRVAERFRAITDKPVKALIYTHSHPDHILGAAAFVTPGADVAIYAHDSLMQEAEKIFSVLQPVITRRSMHMYGNLLEDSERSNVGIGPFVDAKSDSTINTLRPTHTFRDRLDVTIAGVDLVLKHAPGETDDQILVWLPEQKVLLPGDNVYKAFPNLYTIRGTSYRDPKTWADSLDLMRGLGAEILVPGHTRPVYGADAVDSLLTDYRDAIRYVFDQTIRMMNAGMTPDELAPRLRLPPHLAESPYLQFFYGKPAWSARMIYQGQLGWFDSNPSNLHPTPPDERAQRLTALIGGRDALADAIAEAEAAGDAQWVLELTDILLREAPAHTAGREARIRALRTLAENEINPNARHYYLTHAGELAGDFVVPDRIFTPDDAMLSSIPLSAYFDGLAVALDGEAAWDIHQQTVFDFTDLDERYTLIVRRGVTELLPGAVDDADIHVRVDSLRFRQLLAGLRNPAVALARDYEFVEGGRVGLARFLRLFNPDIEVE